MSLKTTLLAVSFSVVAAAANAATVGLLATSTQGVGNTADLYASEYYAYTPDGATWYDGAMGSLTASAAPSVTPPPGSVNNEFQTPFNNTGISESQSYFAVGGESGGQGGSSPMTLELANAVSGLKILWGSIDAYNTIEFFDSFGDSIGAFTGTDIIAAFGLPGKSSTFEQVAKLYFAADAGEDIKYITFTSTSSAFEFALSEVPVPASGLLLMGGLAGVGALRRRKKA